MGEGMAESMDAYKDLNLLQDRKNQCIWMKMIFKHKMEA